MCLIVDANVAGQVLGKSPSKAGAAILDWLSRSGLLVYGGRLYGELSKSPEWAAVLAELERQGKAVSEASGEVDQMEDVILGTGLVTSDDPHVLALARVSGARVLFSLDELLGNDFKNRSLLQPKGKIYKTEAHSRVLSHCPGCRGYGLRAATRARARRR